MDQPPPPAPSSQAPESDPISSHGMVPLRPRQQALSLLDGRWELREPLGDGGTARVYRAHDRQQDRAVAVKLLHPELARERAMRERFRREAYAANLVPHPAVVQILGDGEMEDGTPYLVMELLEGETLEQRLERKGGRLPATEVLWAMDRVLDALAAAHAKGIVHRDLKPDNIFVTHDRRVKVLDFGIARLKEEHGAKLTQIGFVMGTPSFMPPEQARGAWDEVGVQTDLWAVGATMFYLLSGRLVHEGTHVHDVVKAATSQQAPSLRDVAPHLPAPIIDLVDLALAFDMDRRWRGARLMRHALRKAHAQLRFGDGPDSEEDSTGEPPTVGLDDAPEPPPTSLRPAQLAPQQPPLILGDQERKATLDTLPSARPEDLARPPAPAPPASASTSALDPGPAPGRRWLVPALALALLALLALGLLRR